MKFEHLFRMTDSTGIFQHSKFSVPDFGNGYTTDDNSRALIIACWLYSKTREKKFLDLIYTYISFMYYAQNGNGSFHNIMNYQRRFIDETSSDDCFGRSFWSIGFTDFCKNSIPTGIAKLNEEMIEKSLPKIKELTFPRAKAYTLIGLSYLKDTFFDEASELIPVLTDEIIEAFNKNRTDDWYWFEDIITYGNGIIPYAILRAYECTGQDKYLNFGIEILEFLDSIVLKDNFLKLIGCNGWYKKGEKPAEFDEQPVDALDMILSYSKAYRLTKSEKYLHKANTCYSWFKGNNFMKQSMINTENDGCYDGITAFGINRNQGSESQFAYIMSKLTIESL